MITQSTPENCVIHNMAVAAASLTPNHVPNQPVLQAFYNRMTEDQRTRYYDASTDAMSRLSGTDQTQWLSYYNQHMVGILAQITNNQDVEALGAIVNMLETIGK